MMSTEQIVSESRKAAAKAARLHKKPYLFEEEDREEFLSGPIPFPFIGPYVPRGWEMIEHYLVDSSGFGSESEPAYTIQRFVSKILRPGSGYAIIEAGEFQVVIGEFKKL